MGQPQVILNENDFLKTYTRPGSGKNALNNVKWLPLRSTPELAELVGYIFADGSVERSYGSQKTRPKRIDFISDTAILRKRVRFLFKSIFDVEPTKKLFRNTKGLRIRNAAAARALWLAGIPMGSKVSQNYDVPEWIKGSGKGIKKSFVRAYFDCDASKPFKITNSKASFGIRVTINKVEKKVPDGLNFLNSVKNILKEFEIECNGPYIRKSKTYVNRNGVKTIMLELLIQRQLSFLHYSKHIGFKEPTKKEKLKSYTRKIIKSSKYAL